MYEVNQSAFYFYHNCGLDSQLNILAIQPENTELWFLARIARSLWVLIPVQTEGDRTQISKSIDIVSWPKLYSYMIGLKIMLPNWVILCRIVKQLIRFQKNKIKRSIGEWIFIILAPEAVASVLPSHNSKHTHTNTQIYMYINLPVLSRRSWGGTSSHCCEGRQCSGSSLVLTPAVTGYDLEHNLTLSLGSPGLGWACLGKVAITPLWAKEKNQTETGGKYSAQLWHVRYVGGQISNICT